MYDALIVDMFKCGHEKLPSNMLEAGRFTREDGSERATTKCRACEQDRARKRYALNPEHARKMSRLHQEQHRRRKGVLPGNRNAEKTHCPKGHPYSDENTIINVTQAGYRYRECLICRRAKTTARKHARRTNGGSHTTEEWTALVETYNGQCLRCSRKERPLTRDHVVPVILGGTNDIDNIQPLCGPCNSAKGKSTTDYRRGSLSE